MDEKMQAAIDEFITERVNALGAEPPESLSVAFDTFYAAVEKLKAVLEEERAPFLRNCENAFSLLDGEMQYCYYRAGFSDAVSFLLGWRDGAWKWSIT